VIADSVKVLPDAFQLREIDPMSSKYGIAPGQCWRKKTPIPTIELAYKKIKSRTNSGPARTNHTQGKLNAYWCHECIAYHIGHKIKSKYRR
jgi:hypothetical protein